MEKRKGKRKGKVNGKKVFMLTLGVGVAAGSIYLIKQHADRQKAIARNNDDNSDTATVELPPQMPGKSKSGSLIPATITRLLTKAETMVKSEFPLKKGSSGPKVIQLQQALSKIIGSAAMKANGGVDGKFGPGTEKALKQAGLPIIIEEATFNKIVSGNQSNIQIVFDAKNLADQLYRSAQAKDKTGVIAVLKQLKTTDDYSQVNEYYKKIPIISKTIVNDLLNYTFKDNEPARQQFKVEFLRIGLKVDSTGKWSLNGLPQGQDKSKVILYKDIITLRDTYVTDKANRRIRVKENTILGDEVKTADGITWFRAVDNTVLQVPTEDVKYV